MLNSYNLCSFPSQSPLQEISFLFLEPFRSGSCSGYMSCLACLSDQSCGWCPSASRCLLRNGPDLELCPERETKDGKGEGQRHLLLAPQHCPLCEEYRDCSACTQVNWSPTKILIRLCHMLLCKGVSSTEAYHNLTLRTRIVSGRSTPVRRVTISAVDGGDWMDPYETPLDVPKCATSELKLI